MKKGCDKKGMKGKGKRMMTEKEMPMRRKPVGKALMDIAKDRGMM